MIAACNGYGPGMFPNVAELTGFIETGLEVAASCAPQYLTESPDEVGFTCLTNDNFSTLIKEDSLPESPKGIFYGAYGKIRDAVRNGYGMDSADKHGEFGPIRPISEQRIFRTNRGLVGRALNDIKVGDSICLIEGCQVPFIFRQSARIGSKGLRLHQFVSKAYIHGAMDGEPLHLPGSFTRIMFVE
jgi:hypothetical protein